MKDRMNLKKGQASSMLLFAQLGSGTKLGIIVDSGKTVYSLYQWRMSSAE